MSRSNDTTDKRVRETLAGRALLLVFGLAVLSFLVAIDRADWFAIRPATGTSIALSNAASTAGNTTPSTEAAAVR